MKLQGKLRTIKGGVVDWELDQFASRDKIISFIEQNKVNGWKSECVYKLDGSIYVNIKGRIGGVEAVVYGELKKVN